MNELAAKHAGRTIAPMPPATASGGPVSRLGLLLALSVTSIFVGLIWDISWHMTIGRDTFWTPAHMAIYLGGAIPGLTCGVLAVRTTFFGTAAERAASVVIWGGRAPFGAWIVIWGALAMLTAGPFDDWWHSAYGLDVKIISPPHILLFIGMFSVVGGTLLFLARDSNLGTQGKRGSGLLFVYAAGCLTGLLSYLFFAEGWPNRQHTASFYYISAWIYPGVLMAVARAARIRWAATLCALSYMAILVTMIWILPRFSASPKLGPILIPLDRMAPPYFPYLLVFPALIIDLLHARSARETGPRVWLLAAMASVLFIAVFMAIQWNFSKFLLSPASRNAVFVGDQSWPYYSSIGDRRHIFWLPDDLFLPGSLLRIALAAIISGVLGTLAGFGMRKVIR